MTPESNPNLLLAGIVGAAKGLRGEVGVEVRTDRADDVFAPGALLATSSADHPELRVRQARNQSGRLLLQFEGVEDRNAAEALRGTHLLVEGEEEDDAWYPHDLEGLTVVDTEGQVLGEVTGLLASPAHDLLRVDCQGTEVLVPFVAQIVTDVAVKRGRVTVDAPEGLFPSDPGRSAD